MTFIESIYNKIFAISSVGKDEFSIDLLSQSRSYFSSFKARQIEASNATLVQLMNKLVERKLAMEMGLQHPALQAAALKLKYNALAKEVVLEVAQRTVKHSLGTIRVRKMLMKAITDLLDKAHPSALPIIIC